MTTLQEHWAATTTPKPRKTPKPKKALQRCQGCGLQSWGVRCRKCQHEAMRTPLDPCTRCDSPMHRHSTPEGDRKPGSRRHHGRGLCTVCYNIATGKTLPPGARPEPKRRTLPAPVVPSEDESPLTEDELLSALCTQADPEAWFPEQGGSTREAKRVCSGCPIQARCLAVSLTVDPEPIGIWGGTSVRTRRKLRQKREAALAAVEIEEAA